MDALIFAAGRGTRLRPLTDAVPKALIDVGGVPMLERVARRLVAAGVTRIVVNAHAYPDRIEAFVRDRDGFGVEVRVSREEPEPLETGGGLWHARGHLRGEGPIVLHNADVLTDLPLDVLLAAHRDQDALATLAVMERRSSRGLLFDAAGLCGRIEDLHDVRTEARPARGPMTRLAFAGVHVVARRLLERIAERGRFSILAPYLRLAGEGERILPWRADGCAWIDIGRPADLARARAATARTSS